MASISNIFIDQGTDFSITVDVTQADGAALNLTGYSAAAQIRKTYGSSNVSAVFNTWKLLIENINNEIIKRCYNNFKGHNFIPKRELGMYGELFYVCSICGYEKL